VLLTMVGLLLSMNGILDVEAFICRSLILVKRSRRVVFIA